MENVIRRLEYQGKSIIIPDIIPGDFESELDSIISYLKLMNYQFSVNESSKETLNSNADFMWLCFEGEEKIFNIHLYHDTNMNLKSMEFECRSIYKQNSNVSKNKYFGKKYKSAGKFLERVKEYITINL